MKRYNVVWNTPGKDHNDSMPLGNGDIGLNAWVEENGDLLFYISKTDSWDDNGRLLKVGKVRITLDPNPRRASAVFSQTLFLQEGLMRVQFGSGRSASNITLWVDANRPIIHMEIAAPRPVAATASIELWRNAPCTLPSVEVSDVMARHPENIPTVVEPDTVISNLSGRIGWYHRNIKSVGPELLAGIQGIGDFRRPDPLLHRIFGAVIQSRNGEKIDGLHLRSPTAKKHNFDIAVLTRHPSTPEKWRRAACAALKACAAIPIKKQRKAHERWWRDFWDRSWIHVTAPKGDDAFAVSRACALQRYINACAGRGRYPIKFNGSIFTVPSPDTPGDADYRRWGPGYWWQNTRLPYIGMCASGDFDLMQPLFKMYARDLMPLFKFRTMRHTGHAGAYIPECIYFWGDIFSVAYGWTPFTERNDKLQESGYHKWEWVSGLELVFMMLDYHEHTLDAAFLRKTLLPAAREILTFFDKHYRVNASGKLRMHPSQALETWWDCTNPMPELAGLHAVTERLLSLDKSLTTAGQRAFWAALNAKLPDLPTHEVKGRAMLAPAEKFADKENCENPELYAVFPFRRFAVGKPRRELAIEALKSREDRGNFGWRQDDIWMAYLGLADQAKKYLVGRARNKHALSRFPAFWGPNYDWIPDQDHGGVLLKTLQAMLLQTDGRKIYLLPAWPKGWNAEFKLHAPYDTVVEAKIRDGRVARLKITPKRRRRDVLVLS